MTLPLLPRSVQPETERSTASSDDWRDETSDISTSDSRAVDADEGEPGNEEGMI